MPRLSDLLSKAPANVEFPVEGFLSGVDDDGEPREVIPGHHQMIDVGKVLLNFVCKSCDEVRTFASGRELSCLVVGDRVVSIDACLTCIGCDTAVECWFLVVAREDLNGPLPTVRLERYVDNRRDGVSRVGAQAGRGDFDELLERAQLAYEHQLGQGAMVYLRIIFETLTRQVATVAGVPMTGRNGRARTFRDILEAVDEERHIIPHVFSNDRYELYRELSEIVHGRSTEAIALEKYRPCESLVRGVIENVARDEEMRQAINDLGWAGDTGAGLISGEDVAS